VEAECADLLTTRGREVAGSVDGLQEDVHQEACPAAFLLAAFQEEVELVQRGVLDESLEAG
jgi:DNA-binding FrmR family transcriptional regulator